MDSHSILLPRNGKQMKAGPCECSVLRCCQNTAGSTHQTYSQTGLVTAWHRQKMDPCVLCEPLLHLASLLHNGIPGQSWEMEVLAIKAVNCPFSLPGLLTPGCCGNLGCQRITDSVLQALSSQQCQRRISRHRETHLRKLTNKHRCCGHAGFICRWLFSLSIIWIRCFWLHQCSCMLPAPLTLQRDTTCLQGACV